MHRIDYGDKSVSKFNLYLKGTYNSCCFLIQNNLNQNHLILNQVRIRANGVKVGMTYLFLGYVHMIVIILSNKLAITLEGVFVL